MQLSLFVVFLIWLRFLVDFRFADFRLIRISALPVFHISRFLDLPFTCQPVSRAIKAFKKGVLYHGENCNRGPKNYPRILQPTLLLVNRWPYVTHLLGRLQPRSQGSLLLALRSERETLENAGHVSPRIWEITNKRFGGRAGKCETGQCSHQTVCLTWSWTRKLMHKVLWQRKRNFLQNIWMLIGC